jgi:hypothetical protein
MKKTTNAPAQQSARSAQETTTKQEQQHSLSSLGDKK